MSTRIATLLATTVLVVTALLLVNCTSTVPIAGSTSTNRVYHGTASVGDFMTVTVNSTAQTIAYTDVSNDTSGTVTYSINSDGTYNLSDSTGNLVGAYEVPNYALLIQAAKTGPSANTPALITAVESGPISMYTFEEQSYNYMQFRTAAGGLEVGSVSVNSQGVGSNSSFWPYGAYNAGNQGQSPFNTGTIDMTQAQLDASGTYLKIPEPNDPSVSDYVFGTANGIFAVDTQNGAILGLRKAAGAAFDPTVAGTYKAIYYQKTAASTGPGNIENGTPSLAHAILTVTSGGIVTVNSTQGNLIVQGSLAPVASTSYLYKQDMTELQDTCYGLFTFRITTAGVAQQDVFVAFMGQAMLFASFTANLAQQGTYSYFYGVGLK